MQTRERAGQTASNHPLYTRKTLFQLFMVGAFPLHLWTLLMAFRDFGWVALRTVTWDGVGLVAYALAIALLESLFVFVVMLALGLLVPWSWTPERRAALLGTLYLLLAAWSVIGKLYGLYGSPVPAWLMGSAHPLRLMWAFIVPAVTLSILLPALALLRSERPNKSLLEVFDRLALLSALYIILDVLGFVVILLRNIPEGT